jgi:hypothetical protein
MTCFAVILTTLNVTRYNTWPGFNSRLSTLYNALGVTEWLSKRVANSLLWLQVISQPTCCCCDKDGENGCSLRGTA